MKENFERLSSLERRFVVGVLVVVFVVLNAMFVWPRFSDWNKMEFRMAKARRTLAIFQANTNDIPKYEKEVRAMESENPAVPPEDQAVEFVRAIQSQAAQSGVTITVSTPQPSRGTNQFFLERAQGITVQAGEQQLVDFLYNLGAGNSLIRVRDLSQHRDPSGMKLAANIKLVASYQKKPASRPAAPAAAAAKPATPTVKKP